jgi:hypothetical protein
MNKKPEAIQHAICQIAIECLDITFKTFRISGSGGIFKLIQDICKYSEMCRKEISNRKLSSIAIKNIKNAQDIIKKKFKEGMKSKSPQIAGTIYLSIIYACTILIEDAHNTSPDWFIGDNWKELYRLTEEFQDRIIKIDTMETIQSVGTEIYCKIAI